MKTPAVLTLCAVFALVAGCATVESRVQDHQAAFNSWPADVQEKVKAKKVEVGFTREMVEVALGKPDRVASRTTSEGQSEAWIYNDKGPKFSFGIGLGSMHGNTGVGGGVTVGDDFRDDEAMRVLLQGDRVTGIEVRR